MVSCRTAGCSLSGRRKLRMIVWLTDSSTCRMMKPKNEWKPLAAQDCCPGVQAFRISPQNAREHKASPNVRNQISNAWEVETSSRGQGAVLSRRAIVSSAMLAIVGNQLSISPVLAANDGCLADCLRECYAIAPKVIMSSSKSFLIVRLIYKRRILLSSNQLEVCIVSLMHS